MTTRRTFLSCAACSSLLPLRAQQRAARVVLYASVGPELRHYDVDVAAATLTHRSAVTLPSSVQYAWPHVSHRVLYVASSDAVGEPGSTRHNLTALRIDPQTGELRIYGESLHLPARPIHVSTDIPSEYVLVAFNNPSGVRVFRVEKDFIIGAEVPQPGITDDGIYGHQIRVTPDNRHATFITRGNNATPQKPEDPGAIKVFDYNRGALSAEVSIAPNHGIGFGPRHLDFHPSKPWVYVSLERQNQLWMYRLAGGKLTPDALFRKETLAQPAGWKLPQMAGAVHVHPNGRFLYVANRNDGTLDAQAPRVFGVGENTIAVYSIDQRTGEPTLIQNANTRKVHPRTFHIDPSGRLLVAEHNTPANLPEGGVVPAGLTIFRIGDDGRLTFERTLDIEVGKATMWWMGMVRLPQ
jgi:6-phosphogluconolactonase (cycloisomerase 2 family)